MGEVEMSIAKRGSPSEVSELVSGEARDPGVCKYHVEQPRNFKPFSVSFLL
jgi:hypothetical protein